MPRGHGRQAAEELAPTADEKVPLGQGLGAIILESGQKEPGLHFRNINVPETGQYSPSAQGWHIDDDEPVLDWYVPGGHGVGLTVPSVGQ